MKTLKELKQVLTERVQKKSLFEKDIECFEAQILQSLSRNANVSFYPVCFEHYGVFRELLIQKGYVFKEGVCSGETTIVIDLGEVK